MTRTITASLEFGFNMLCSLWGDRPSDHGVMTRPGSRSKYYTVRTPLTDHHLMKHIVGRATYAASLIGADDTARGLVIELDTGGLTAARATLDAITRKGLTAFSIAVRGSGDHDGSHTWLLYDEAHEPNRLKAQSIALLNDASLPVKEVYPGRQKIRLPFGMHRRTYRRGTLVFQTGETFNLDDDVERAVGILTACALPRNTIAPPPEIAVSGRTPIARSRIYGRANESLPGAQFNEDCPREEVIKMLTQHGWTVAGRNGSVIYLRRPGKQTGGHSATLGYLSPGNILCVFSTGDADLPHNRPGVCTAYTPWAVYTYLYHSGDFVQSARALYRHGYGALCEGRKR